MLAALCGAGLLRPAVGRGQGVPLPDSSATPAPISADSLRLPPPPPPADTVVATVVQPDTVPRPPPPTLHDYPYADSLTAALHRQGRWRALDSVGRLARAAQTDYPALRCRLADAALATGRPSAALAHTACALRASPLDTGAHYAAALACLALGRREAAAWHTRTLPDPTRRLLHLPTHRLLDRLQLELSGQTTTSAFRGEASVARVGVGSRLSPAVSLLQSVARFGQTVRLPELARRPICTVRQGEYHGLLTEQLGARWQARGGYSYLGSRFGATRYPGHLAYGALAYQHPTFEAVVGAYAGRLTDTTRHQTDLRLTAYPLGNLSLYIFGRGSVVQSGGRSYPNAGLGLGGRLQPTCWLEAFGNAGRVPVLAEADGTAVYNLLDPRLRRGGVGAYLALPHHLLLRLHYTAERRRRALHPSATYSIYALATALEWTW